MSASSLPPTFKTPFDSMTLRAVAHELRLRLVGGQVQDIRQPSTLEVRIGIRSLGQNHWLAISCDARFARAHLTSARAANAPVPPSFCMALRRHCEGAVVRDIRQRGFDRVLEIEIGARGDEGGSAAVVLMAELMGKHSNLILVGPDGVVLEAAKRISRRINRVREVLPGLSYAPPPEQSDRLDPFAEETMEAALAGLRAVADLDPASAREWLSQNLAGVSPFLADDFVRRLERAGGLTEAIPDVWREIFGAAARHAYRPVALMVGDRIVGAYPFELLAAPPEAQSSVEDLNGALDAAFSRAVGGAEISSARADLRALIESDAKRFRRQAKIAQETLQEAERAERYRQDGELILGNLWRIDPEAQSVTVEDYFDADLPPRTLRLDPKLSPQENAEALFRRYRKARDAQVTAEAREAEADAALSRLQAASAELEAVRDEEPRAQDLMREIRETLRTQGFLRSRGAEAEEGVPGPDLQGHKIRRVSGPDGYEIYIGESATANDFLTTRLAAPNDLWLHVRASTSAHVMIKSRGRPDQVPRAVIEHAALLCARHSSQKHSGLVPVDVTLKKHVRKPRGAAPGSADYHHETTLHVTP